MEPNQVRVVAGSQFRYDMDEVRYHEVLDDIIIHENFSRSSLEGNIAIGILSVALPDNDSRLSFIDIEDLAFYPPVIGTKCKIYGWSLSTRFEVSPHLLTGEISIDDISACDTTTNKITSTTLCAGPYHVNGCETDDGAPLICGGRLFGLVDHRPQGYCSRIITSRLGTYVDISAYHDWISEYSENSGAGKVFVPVILICVLNFICRFIN